MKYKFILFSPWLLKRPVKTGKTLDFVSQMTQIPRTILRYGESGNISAIATVASDAALVTIFLEATITRIHILYKHIYTNMYSR